MKFEVINGDLLEQEVDVIVNSWNRNIIPWWLLIPQGVSGAIKKKAGYKPFIELSKFGPIPLGKARLTSAGKLPFQGIIHVAGINMFWFGTEYSVIQSVRNAMQIVNQKNYTSVAFPLIGAGSGNRSKTWSLNLIGSELEKIKSESKALIVCY